MAQHVIWVISDIPSIRLIRKVGDIHIQLTSRASSVTDLIWTIPLPLNFFRIELHRNVENRLKMMSEEEFGSEVKIDHVISKNASVSDAA
jgi:hypothetical protein